MADTPARARPDRWAPPGTTVVTGANGWLGRALVHRLLADGDRVRLRLLAHSTADAASLREFVGPGDHVQIIIGDIAKADTARRLLHAADGDTDVVHTAGVIHPARVREFTAINTEGTRHLAAAALDAGVRRMVHVSSNSPFGTNPHRDDTFRGDEPYHPYLGYGRSKMFAELAVNDAVTSGLDATIVRPPWFYGPFQPPRQTTFFRMVRAGKFPVIGSGDQRRSMVFVENLVDGVLAAELTPAARGKGYWIADARAYTVTEIVETVGRALVDEGLEREATDHAPAPARGPSRRGGRPAVAGPGRLPAAVARPRRDGPHHRLRHRSSHRRARIRAARGAVRRDAPQHPLVSR